VTLAVCCWLGLIGSIVELTVLWLRRMSQPLLKLSDDYAWSVPAALVGTVLLVILPLLLAGRWRPRPAYFAAVLVAAAVVFLDMLLLFPGLAPYAAAVLAAGLGAQVARSAAHVAASTASLVRRSAPALLVLLGALAGGIWMSSRPAAQVLMPAPGAGPNVLVITLDTVRAASLSLYGASRETTPNLTRYGAQGVVFDQAYSVAPWTLPAHASLFTGRWPHELSVGYREPLDEQSQTLAEHFAARGYATAGFVANLGYCSRSTGLARGFGHYEDYPRSLGQVAANSTLLRTVADNFNVRRLIADDEHLNRVTANDINRRFQDWLVTNRDAPFFVFLNYFDAHEPYLPPPPFDRQFGPGRQHGRFSPLHHAQWDPAAASRELDPVALTEEIDAYDGALASLDHQLGVLLDDLSARGLLDRTLVIITSDHGEEFAEHRVLEHGYSLYRAALQVPLLMILPGVVPEALRIPTPVSLRDVAATVVELTGGTASTIGGTSLSRFWLGDDESGSPVVSELSRPPGNLPEWYPVNKGHMRSLVHRGFRYIRNGDRTEELYALEADPWERLNLAVDPRYADILREASTRLDEAGGVVR
jgi:arylsulfatase A-like enzyme